MPKSVDGYDMRHPRPRNHASGPDFDLRIGEMVIDGYTVADSRAIASALEKELGRLLKSGLPPLAARHGSAAGDLAIERIDAGMINTTGVSPHAIGRAAARAVVQGLRALPAGRNDSLARWGGK